jgi:hypothetical protein
LLCLNCTFYQLTLIQIDSIIELNLFYVGQNLLNKCIFPSMDLLGVYADVKQIPL